VAIHLDYDLYLDDCRTGNLCDELFQVVVERLAVFLAGSFVVHGCRYSAGSNI